jgi:hypothetical protein
LWFLVILDRSGGGGSTVTTEAASRTPAGEAGFRLLAEHLSNLILLAFDAELLTSGGP